MKQFFIFFIARFSTLAENNFITIYSIKAKSCKNEKKNRPYRYDPITLSDSALYVVERNFSLAVASSAGWPVERRADNYWFLPWSALATSCVTSDRVQKIEVRGRTAYNLLCTRALFGAPGPSYHVCGHTLLFRFRACSNT